MVRDKYPGNSSVYCCSYLYKIPISLNWFLTLLIVTFEVSRVLPVPRCGLPKQVSIVEDLSVFIRL